jgi:predicted DNA binding CopG/RHH family protein
MTKAYEDMTDAELEQLTDEVLRDHVSGAAPFQPLGERATRTRGTVAISLRIPASLLDRIKSAAADQGVPYQRLMKLWLQDAADRNAPVQSSKAITLRLTPEEAARLRDEGAIDIHLEAV